MNTWAIVPAAGAGTRLKGKVKKQFLSIGGKPVLARTLLNLSAAPEIDKIIVVAPSSEISRCKREIVDEYGMVKVNSVIEGGSTRQESVGFGFAALPDDVDLVIVHDGVRPFITGAMISSVVEAAAEYGAAITAINITDTIKEIKDETVVSTLKRDSLARVQTPQCFRHFILNQAMERALLDGFEGTDEASLVERLNVSVKVVEGSAANIKITTADDLKLAEALLNIDFK